MVFYSSVVMSRPWYSGTVGAQPTLFRMESCRYYGRVTGILTRKIISE
jgi:hypothetical protein